MRLLLALVVAVVAALACENADPAPPAPVGGTGGGRTTAPNPPKGSDGGPADAPIPADAATVPGCLAPPDSRTNRAVVTQSGVDRGFTPSSAFATYSPAPCDSSRRELVLVLTEDERCTADVGRRLVVVVDETEVGAGLVPLGSPLQLAFSSALALRYIEPGGPTSDGALWGNCSESADGDITFERLDVGVTDGRATATFEATLVDCSATGTEPPVQVSGAIDVPLVARFDEVCDPT